MQKCIGRYKNLQGLFNRFYWQKHQTSAFCAGSNLISLRKVNKKNLLFQQLSLCRQIIKLPNYPQSKNQFDQFDFRIESRGLTEKKNLRNRSSPRNFRLFEGCQFRKKEKNELNRFFRSCSGTSKYKLFTDLSWKRGRQLWPPSGYERQSIFLSRVAKIIRLFLK